METYAEINAKMMLAEQVTFMQEDGERETPHVEYGSQFNANALESLVQTRKVCCSRCAQAHINQSIDWSKYNTNTTFQILDCMAVGNRA